MCGIAGVINLRGQRDLDPRTLDRMAAALRHRGPDDEGFFHEPPIGLVSRRLSIIGLADGQQPVFSRNRDICVVYNGELFDYVEKRDELTGRGHRFRTSCDTEVLVHLWEEFGEGMFAHLRGQFAFALYDARQRTLILARDRVGICPLHWARRGDWLYFGSEIKAILASGGVQPEPDLRGIDHIFTFFAMGTRRTAFRGVSSLYPGTYLKIQLGGPGESADLSEHVYWDLDFPDRGDELPPEDPVKIVDEFRSIFFRAVEVRLRADVPVVGYLSGGVDSATVMAVAERIRGEPMDAFTVRIPTPRFDESQRANAIARELGCRQTVVTCDSNLLARTYPDLIRAADCPVVDTSCAALYLLAREVHAQGFKVALTGEGADEALAGYPWFKTNKLMGLLDVGGLRPSDWLRRAIFAVSTHEVSWRDIESLHRRFGGSHAQADFYALVGSTRERLYSGEMSAALGGHVAWEDLDLDLERMRRWHPLNRSIYVGYKTILPGLLMNHKGDRVAMASAVENRYPFLDEDLIAFCSRLAPRFKLRGILRDKHVLREVAAEVLPRRVARRPKMMFRAPFGATFFADPPAYVSQLLSRESLATTGYFDADRVHASLQEYRASLAPPGRRVFVEMGLAAVLATQLWHHSYMREPLCELPAWSPPS